MKNIYFLNFFFFFTLTSLFATDQAMPQAYGNKYRHLAEMEQLVSRLGVQDVEIPRFYGLASRDVLAVLNQADPMIAQLWSQLGQTYQPGIGFLAQAHTQALLSEIQQRIEQVFSQIRPGQIAQLFSLPPDFFTWLQSLHQQDKYLMVRSSGDEDSKVLANAGGNLSVAYVAPRLSDLLKASGQVVASYFGVNSLRNRIKAGQNPFALPLKLSVLLQELIGEPIGGASDPKQIPQSLVLFTNEPLYVDGESFRIMRISTTWGHAEGVVGNQGINSDSILLVSSKNHPGEPTIFYDNERKPVRLVPQRDSNGQVHLTKIGNSSDRVTSRVLDEELLKRLYVLGVRFEDYFQNKATDMEIVIKNGVIYPVQARPVNRPKAYPTYLDVAEANRKVRRPIVQMTSGKVIVSGLASTLVLKPDQILAVEKLAEGEGLFNEEIQKLVIVSQDEPANSHPVVNFSSSGVPVICIGGNSFSDLISRYDGAQHVLVVDSQAGTVTLWDKTIADPQLFIKDGYVVHPASVNISLDLEQPKVIHFGESPPILSRDLQELLKRIQEPGDRLVALHALDTLRNHPFVTRLCEWPSIVQTQLNMLSFGSIQGDTLVNMIQAYERELNQAFEALQHALQDPQTGRLEMLFYAKVLVALLGNQQVNKNGVAQIALPGLDAFLLDTEEALAYEKSFAQAPRLTSLLIERHNALTQQQNNQWVEFLKTLDQAAQNPEQATPSFFRKLEIFQEIVVMLKETHSLSLWMTFFCHPQTGQSAETLLDNTLKPFDIDTKKLMITLKETREQIDQMEQHVDDFGEPHSFAKAWGPLLQLVSRYTKADDPSDPVMQIAKASPLGQAVAAEVLKQMVDFYDLSIKTMKASNRFDPQVRALQLKEMLGPFFYLLKSWVVHINQETDFAMQPGLSLDLYLDQIESALLGMQATPDKLQRSANFNVRIVSLGGGSGFYFLFPQTLEDIFTLIHQNLLVSVAAVMTKISLESETNLPAIVNQMVDATHAFRQARLVGLQIDAGSIVLFYNLPLAYHSATFQLIFNKSTGQSQVAAQFMGESYGRWEVARDLAQVLSRVGILTFAKPAELTHNLLELTWNVTDRASIDKSLSEIDLFAEYSLTRDVETLTSGLTKMLQQIGVGVEQRADFALKIAQTENGQLIGARLLLNLAQSGIGFDQALKAARSIMADMTEPSLETILIQSEVLKIWELLLQHHVPEVAQDMLEYLSTTSDSDQRAGEVLKLLSQHQPSLVQRRIEEAYADLRSSDRSIADQALLFLKKAFYIGQAQQATALVKALLEETSASVRRRGMSLLNTLIPIHQVPVVDLENLINQGMHDSNWEVREESLYAMENWINTGDLPFNGIEYSAELLDDSHLAVQKAAVAMFRALAMKDGVLSQDRHLVASTLMKSQDTAVQEAALYLYSQMVKSGTHCKEAAQAARIGLDPNKDALWKQASNVLQNLAIYKYEIPLVIETAIELAERDSEAASDIWHHLIPSGNGIDQASALIKSRLEHPNGNWKVPLKITSDLMETGQDYDLAVKVAFAATQNTDWLSVGLEHLWIGLINHGHTSAAIHAVELLLTNRNINTAVELAKILVDRGHAYEIALQAASAGIRSSRYAEQYGARSLIFSLMEKGQTAKLLHIPEASDVLNEVNQKTARS